jgi:hypothetical protein
MLDYLQVEISLLQELKADYFKTLKNEPTQNDNAFSGFEWNGKVVDFIELFVSLVKSGIITKHQKEPELSETINYFSQIFHIEVNSLYQKLGDIKRRKKIESTMWGRLIQSFQQYLDKASKE